MYGEFGEVNQVTQIKILNKSNLVTIKVITCGA